MFVLCLCLCLCLVLGVCVNPISLYRALETASVNRISVESIVVPTQQTAVLMFQPGLNTLSPLQVSPMLSLEHRFNLPQLRRVLNARPLMVSTSIIVLPPISIIVVQPAVGQRLVARTVDCSIVLVLLLPWFALRGWPL